MNILVIISEAPPIVSGVSRVCEAINSRLRAAGHTVDVISSHDIPRLELGEVRLSTMPWNGLRSVLLGMRKYDLVHIHGPAPTFSDVALAFARFNRLIGGPPIVYTHHCEIELPGKQLLCAPYNALHRTLAGLADQVVVSTPSYADSFRTYLPEQRVSVIPWGVDLQPPVFQKPEGMNVLYVGQLRPYKGLDVLLRAAQQLPDVRVTVVGSGHRAEYYRDLAHKLNLQNIHFTGRLTDEGMRQAYADAHALILPSLSRAEAFGLVLLEGMAAGCVPIASRLPGLTDVIGDVGYTFPVGDAHALADTIRTIQKRHNSLNEMSHAARHWAERFSWDTTASAYENLYLSLIERRAYRGANWFPQVRPTSVLPSPTLTHALFTMLQDLFEHVVRLFAPSRASLLFPTATADQMMIVAAKGLDPALIGTNVSSRESLFGWVAALRQPICINPSVLPDAVRPFLHTQEAASLMLIPVVYNHDVVGVLNIARHSLEHPYTTGDLDRLVACVPRLLQDQVMVDDTLLQVA